MVCMQCRICCCWCSCGVKNVDPLVSGKLKDEKMPDSNNNSKNRDTSDFLNALATQIDASETPHPNIAALAAHCGDNILNPEYLLSGQDPPFSSR